MTRSPSLPRLARLFPEKKCPMRESLPPGRWGPAEAFTGDFYPSPPPAGRRGRRLSVNLRRARQSEASTLYRFLLERAGPRRTLSGDAQNALAIRSWLGRRASQRIASVNYSGAHADVALTYMTNRFAGQIEADAPLALATAKVK